jgi:hypothetical protein
MSFELKTRSINVLITGTSPGGHTIATPDPNGWYGPPVNITETFYPPAAQFVFNTLYPSSTGSAVISPSSLKIRNGQTYYERYMTASVNYGGTVGNQYNYNFGSNYTDSFGNTKSGTPHFVYHNFYQTNWPQYHNTPSAPVMMSQFSADGQTNAYATNFILTNTFQFQSISVYAATIMEAPPTSNTDPDPISFGPSAGFSV